MGLWPAPPAACAPPMLNASGGLGAPFGHLLNAAPSAFTQVQLAAGTVVLTPLELPEPLVVQKGFWLNGSTGLAGSVQVGVYSDELGLLAAATGTVQAGASVLQEAAISPAVQLPRGLVYLAVATSGAGTLACWNAFGGSTAIALQLAKAAGLMLATGGYPLPDSLTGVATTAGIALAYGLASRALVV